jgi:D-arabinose 1-dehydrogenase-like Zn-dependent alcohol dehydrogenase
MRAVRLVEIGRPLQQMEIPVPSIGDDEVLIRIKAAGICHSDVHYWAGISPVGTLPQTLGHEIAGVVEEVGPNVTTHTIGQRVCLHYLVTCGDCAYCRSSSEQFCEEGLMLGKDIAGGYAEYVAVPGRNAVPLHEDLPFVHGAVLMCSSATVFHALRKARLCAGETVAVFGVGGLGMSAVQLARLFGAVDVYAVDIQEEKLASAATYSAIPIDASTTDPIRELRDRTGERGVDVALALVGLPGPMRQAVQSLAPYGRAVLVGLTDQLLCVDTYREVLGREAEIIGCSDHLLEELPLLVELAQQGRLDLSHVVTETIPLEADAVNGVIHRLHRFGSGIRAVIAP